MTTIVYRDGVLASDSQSECNGWVSQANTKKMWRTQDGRLLAITGDQAEASALAEWLSKPKNKRSGDRPKLSDGARVIELVGSHDVIVYEGAGKFKVRGKFFAFGSGSPAALGALYMGATAVQAVKIATRVDIYSGGRVVSVKL